MGCVHRYESKNDGTAYIECIKCGRKIYADTKDPVEYLLFLRHYE